MFSRMKQATLLDAVSHTNTTFDKHRHRCSRTNKDSDGFVMERLWTDSLARLKYLWEELQVPASEQQAFAKQYFTRVSADHLRCINTEVERYCRLRRLTLHVFQCIEKREAHMRAIWELVDQFDQKAYRNVAWIKNSLQQELAALRLATLDCITAHVAWEEAQEPRGPEAPVILWRGECYLAKIERDDRTLIQSSITGLTRSGAPDEYPLLPSNTHGLPHSPFSLDISIDGPAALLPFGCSDTPTFSARAVGRESLAVAPSDAPRVAWRVWQAEEPIAVPVTPTDSPRGGDGGSPSHGDPSSRLPFRILSPSHLKWPVGLSLDVPSKRWRWRERAHRRPARLCHPVRRLRHLSVALRHRRKDLRRLHRVIGALLVSSSGPRLHRVRVITKARRDTALLSTAAKPNRPLIKPLLSRCVLPRAVCPKPRRLANARRERRLRAIVCPRRVFDALDPTAADIAHCIVVQCAVRQWIARRRLTERAALRAALDRELSALQALEERTSAALVIQFAWRALAPPSQRPPPLLKPRRRPLPSSSPDS